MTKKYSRADVSTHATGHHGPQLPAINVKQRHWTLESTVIERFGCTRAQAKQALDFVGASIGEDFWGPGGESRGLPFPSRSEDALASVFGDEYGKLATWSAGRSAGWLVVEGLPEISGWDAVLLAKWRAFEQEIRAEVDYLTSDEYALEMIEANDWCSVTPADPVETMQLYAASLEGMHSPFTVA